MWNCTLLTANGFSATGDLTAGFGFISHAGIRNWMARE